MDKKKIEKEILSQSYNVTDQAGEELQVVDVKDVFDIVSRIVDSAFLPPVRLSSEKIDELWENFCQDVPDDPERVLVMRGTRRMNKSRFIDALGSITDEA